MFGYFKKILFFWISQNVSMSVYYMKMANTGIQTLAQAGLPQELKVCPHSGQYILVINDYYLFSLANWRASVIDEYQYPK